MRNTLQRISVLAMVMLIVTSGFVGTATANTGDVTTGTECQLRGAAGFWGGFLGIDVSQCQTPAENIGENHADIYANGLAAQDSEKFATTNVNNQLNYSANNVLCLSKADIIDGLQNGSDKATVKAQVNETIDTHYVTIQKNVVNGHNTQTNQLWYSAQAAGSAGIDMTVGIDMEQSNGYNGYQFNYELGPSTGATLETRNVTLLNGETAQTSVIVSDYNGNELAPFTSTDSDFMDGIVIREPGAAKVAMGDSYDSTTAANVYSEESWYTTWTSIQSEHDYVTNNAMAYIDDVYAQYGAEDFDETDAQELRDSCDLHTLATDRDSTGSLDWVRIQGATTGLDGDVNHSFVVDYTPASGETYKGDTSISADTDSLTMSSPTLGADAIVTGEETFRVDLTSPGAIESPQLVLRNSSDDSIATSVNLTDTDGDGTYRAPLPGADFSTLTNGDSVTASVETTADGTDTRVDLGTWTYAPDGGVTVELAGGLYTDWKPAATNGSFVTNTTYDTANAESDVIFIDTTGDEPTHVSMDGTFVITEMYNPETEESVESTTLEDYNTQTYDASLTLEEVQKLLDYRSLFEQNWDQTTFGGGDGLGLSMTGGVMGAAIALGAIFLLAREFN